MSQKNGLKNPARKAEVMMKMTNDERMALLTAELAQAAVEIDGIRYVPLPFAVAYMNLSAFWWDMDRLREQLEAAGKPATKPPNKP